MIKVKNIYYTTDITELQTDSGYPTGILFELEDGRWLREQSDSSVMPVEEISPPRSSNWSVPTHPEAGKGEQKGTL